VIEVKIDIQTLLKEDSSSLFCCTTNCIVTKAGKAVMGAGIALLFKIYFPGIDENLGKKLKSDGAGVYLIWEEPAIVAFPTKYHFKDNSAIDLIIKSCHELVNLTKDLKFDRIYLSRPGCGLGGLKWEEVGPIISEILLDDKFVIVNK